MIDRRDISAGLAAAIVLLALAAAMGIGRFAFTPIFPLMQAWLGLTLGQGSWLATANYLGYFLGAAASFWLTPNAGLSARWGLLAVALSTLAMGWTDSFAAWLALRLAAGVASAFVLVGASAWGLAHLALRRRADLAGWVFAGVGVGICVAGAVALVAGAAGAAPAKIWVALGVVAAAVTMLAWKHLSIAAPASTASATDASPAAPPLDRAAWLLIACYGSFGFGYIIPATFIPSAARALVDDPLVFGWAWPLFGLAAAVSTIGVTTLLRAAPPRRTAAASLLVMTVGVALPALHANLVTLVVSALCVGGTFMVMTMAGIQEARRIVTGSPTRLISAMTAAFALGQLAGPAAVVLGSAAGDAFAVPSLVAAVLLAGSALALSLMRDGTTAAVAVHSPKGTPDVCE